MGQYTVTTGARSGILGGLKKGSSMYSGTGMSPDIGGKSLLEGLRGDGIRNMKRKAEEFDDSVEGQRQFITKTLKKSEKIMLDHDVEKTVLDSLVHPTDKSAKAMKMIPVFPDFFMWQNDYSLFTFDDLPMPPFISENEKNVVDLEENKTLSDQAYNTTLLRAREKARGYFDKGKQVWLEYFLPESRDTAAVVAEKRELRSVDSPRDETDTQVEGDLIYKLEREYEFATAPDALRQDNLLLSIRRNERTNEPEAFYMPIKSRFIMKRRNQASTNYLQEDVEDDTSVSHISLSFRAPNADELSASQSALSQLYND
ncbi:hypothetical protein AX774_g2517 [Zancudomyces culisetae]|uniref:Uncharacterized protein n=1 Tax=Zancudomyces culisetae TaxID=1213189 RepID=A0A1R1PSM2_ZANCU|nr:hypothetical protein AX774_g2517 [Zancudomyces culisetae]|eukprot:OMH83970.1 hypothetical protein AX774_g2517 [Zancudomyces culisetae]